MTYVALLYSPSLDQFKTDCNNIVYYPKDMAEWIRGISDYYNHYFNVKDFYIVSITKIGE